MQDLKIYIVIEDPKTKRDISIRGNFEILQAFLSGVGSFEMQSFPARVDPSPLGETVPTATKRKPKTIPQPIPQLT